PNTASNSKIKSGPYSSCPPSDSIRASICLRLNLATFPLHYSLLQSRFIQQCQIHFSTMSFIFIERSALVIREFAYLVPQVSHRRIITKNESSCLAHNTTGVLLRTRQS